MVALRAAFGEDFHSNKPKPSPMCSASWICWEMSRRGLGAELLGQGGDLPQLRWPGAAPARCLAPFSVPPPTAAWRDKGFRHGSLISSWKKKRIEAKNRAREGFAALWSGRFARLLKAARSEFSRFVKTRTSLLLGVKRVVDCLAVAKSIFKCKLRCGMCTVKSNWNSTFPLFFHLWCGMFQFCLKLVRFLPGFSQAGRGGGEGAGTSGTRWVSLSSSACGFVL